MRESLKKTHFHNHFSEIYLKARSIEFCYTKKLHTTFCIFSMCREVDTSEKDSSSSKKHKKQKKNSRASKTSHQRNPQIHEMALDDPNLTGKVEITKPRVSNADGNSSDVKIPSTKDESGNAINPNPNPIPNTAPNKLTNQLNSNPPKRITINLLRDSARHFHSMVKSSEISLKEDFTYNSSSYFNVVYSSSDFSSSDFEIYDESTSSKHLKKVKNPNNGQTQKHNIPQDSPPSSPLIIVHSQPDSRMKNASKPSILFTNNLIHSSSSALSSESYKKVNIPKNKASKKILHKNKNQLNTSQKIDSHKNLREKESTKNLSKIVNEKYFTSTSSYTSSSSETDDDRSLEEIQYTKSNTNETKSNTNETKSNTNETKSNTNETKSNEEEKKIGKTETVSNIKIERPENSNKESSSDSDSSKEEEESSSPSTTKELENSKRSSESKTSSSDPSSSSDSDISESSSEADSSSNHSESMSDTTSST
ncbi:hypothetical protein TRFO_24614 [Tritrichomonas foetus]|uniref:Uncharacterized protein n=1 Tax=Tritrichomonas foetus TaxID=1144522 RepID=A0A1J4KC56_9EUKA|nr:hypothetical protein TRFO_24614 [Tritrichomonas foetus]|eukprot:OHT07276.1 hypothetical protein TRFO_24614 [Tritrichomonas foetus]